MSTSLRSTPIDSSSPSLGRVPYRPELLEELGALQLRLGELTRELERTCRGGETARCAECICAFDGALSQYLIDEGVQFEPYLRYALERDLDTQALMRQLRARLRELAREVHDVADLSARQGAGDRTVRVVSQVMDRVGLELAHCLGRQREVLFPLYRPLDGLPG